MKTKYIIGVSAIASILIAGSALASVHDSEQTLKLGREDVIVNSVVIETTTTSTSTTVVNTLPVEIIDIVNAQIEEGETLTIDQLREKYGKCGEWHDLAIDVGFTEEEWPKVSQIIWKESRCTIDAWNGHDAGLTQVNQIHTEWLNQMGYSYPDDMFDPRMNLEFAYNLYSSREEKGQCGWKPWSLTC